MKNTITPLIIALFLLAGFTANLQAQTVDETMAYLREKLTGYYSRVNTGLELENNNKDKRTYYQKITFFYSINKITGTTIFFETQRYEGKRFRSESEAKESTTGKDCKWIVSASLDKVNFSIDDEGYFKMFSHQNNQSINSDLYDRHDELDSGLNRKKQNYGFDISNKDPKTRAGILKALKHLQKLLGCENGAQDQDVRLKNMFEE